MKWLILMGEENYGPIKFILEKFANPGHNNTITIEDGKLIRDIGDYIEIDDDKFRNFCDKLMEVYEKERHPEGANLAIIISSIVSHYSYLKKNQMVAKIKAFIDELLESENKNLKMFGLELVRKGGAISFHDKDIIDKVINFWSSTDVDIKGISLWALESFSFYNYKQFDIYFQKLIDILTASKDEGVITYSTKLLANIYLNSCRNGFVYELDIDFFNNIFKKHDLIKNIFLEKEFFNGMETFLHEFNEYDTKWIDLYFKVYKTAEVILQSQILRNLCYLPKNKTFQEIDCNKYINFFRSSLEALLENSTEIPPDSIVYIPNTLQDILTTIEQLAYYLPSVVEELLSLYEKVFQKYIPDLVDNRPGFKGMAWQRLHSLYQHLILHNKKKKKWDKLTRFLKKSAKVAFSKSESINLTIESLKCKIVILINKNDLKLTKEVFNKLNRVFEEYKSEASTQHECVPIWTVLEDLIYLNNCEIIDFPRELSKLEEHLILYRENLPDSLSSLIFNKFGSIGNLKINIEKSKSYSECQVLISEITKELSSIMAEIIEMPSPILKAIFEKIIFFQGKQISEIRSRIAINHLTEYRRLRRFPEAKDKDFDLWSEIVSFFKELDLKELFPTNLPTETEINKKIHRKLKERFESAELNKTLTGTSHIDISVFPVAIEVKKIESNTPKDEMIGQIAEDERIGSYTYGISLGIDITKRRKYLQLNGAYIGQDRNISLIIKPYKI